MHINALLLQLKQIKKCKCEYKFKKRKILTFVQNGKDTFLPTIFLSIYFRRPVIVNYFSAPWRHKVL